MQRGGHEQLRLDVAANAVPPATASDPSELEGIIDRITFHSEESGFTVARLSVAGRVEPVTVVGQIADVNEGESVLLFGEWSRHPKFGPQFKFHRYQLVTPTTPEAIRKYLGSGLVPGIGPKMAKNLVDAFGTETLDVIERHAERLREVPGIGAVRAGAISAAWAEQRMVRNIMLFLHGHGVSSAYAVRIYKTYGDRAIEVVRDNPYQLATDVRGIGFRIADHIAEECGIAKDSPHRIRAGLLHLLDTAAEEGHCYLPSQVLLERAVELLGVEIDQLTDGLRDLIQTRRVEPHDTSIYLPSFHACETDAAQQMARLLAGSISDPPTAEQTERWLTRTFPDLQLSRAQLDALVASLQNRVLIVTGGPGTGKTTVTRIIVAAHQGLRRRVLLASPTGRAAKRLAEVTGREAKTIHRLLEYQPERHAFRHDQSDPLEVDLLVVDEASMLDIQLFDALLRAVPDGARIVFVGDVDQLPSVGPGNVLKDLINSGCVPVVRLVEVFRQAAESQIIANAHRVNRGDFPKLLRPQDRSDFVFLEAEEKEDVLRRLVQTVTTNLPRLGFQPGDVQVLSPMVRGEIGVANLNAVLQEQLNPAAAGKPQMVRGPTFRSGDRVIQTRNNYNKGVFNGDVGRITHLDITGQVAHVSFGDEPVPYEFAELDELQLAYATTIHKSQGSEFPCAVVVCHTSHYVMLQRNLLYTALTRARRMVVLIGNQRAIALCVKNDTVDQRYTRLSELLRAATP